MPNRPFTEVQGQIVTSSSLSKSVGENGRNDHSDVLLIQQLLNKLIDANKLIPLRRLAESKKSDAALITAIKMFQRNYLSASQSSGKIEPGSQDFLKLIEMLKMKEVKKLTVKYSQFIVSDKKLRDTLEKISSFFERDISVTSGDRTKVVKGSNPNSLHLHHRAVDFHISGMQDSAVFASLRNNRSLIFDRSESYEVIFHGPFTNTSGPHIHIGRYEGQGSGFIKFKTEGVTKGTSGNYQVELMHF